MRNVSPVLRIEVLQPMCLFQHAYPSTPLVRSFQTAFLPSLLPSRRLPNPDLERSRPNTSRG